MNIRLAILTLGITTVSFGASALPALANTPYTANYGAGFFPSPIIAPDLTSPLAISTTNYGAGFFGSPNLQGGTVTPTVHTANYGAGFFVSPRPWYGYRYWYLNY